MLDHDVIRGETEAGEQVYDDGKDGDLARYVRHTDDIKISLTELGGGPSGGLIAEADSWTIKKRGSTMSLLVIAILATEGVSSGQRTRELFEPSRT